MTDYNNANFTVDCTYIDPPRRGTNPDFGDAITAAMLENLSATDQESPTDARDAGNDWIFLYPHLNATFRSGGIKLEANIEDAIGYVDVGTALENLIAMFCRVAHKRGTQITVGITAESSSYGDSCPNGDDEPHDSFVLADGRIWRTDKHGDSFPLGPKFAYADGTLTCISKAPTTTVGRDGVISQLISDIKDENFAMSRTELINRINDLR